MVSTTGIPLMGGRIWSKFILASSVVWFCSMPAMLTARRDHPEVQEKIKRVITQGHIDPEDFKGVSTLLPPLAHWEAWLTMI